MKFTTLFLTSLLAMSSVFGQAPAAPASAPVPAQTTTATVAPQNAANPNEVVVRIETKQTPAPAQTIQVPVPAAVQKVPSEMAAVGKAIGDSLNGLVTSLSDTTGAAVDKTANITGNVVDKTSSVVGSAMDRTFGKDVTLVDGIDKVSKTDAGRFTMLVVAWKVMGKDAKELIHAFTGVAIGVPIQILLVILAVWITRRFWMVRSVVLSKTGPFWQKDRKIEYVAVNDKLDSDTRFTGLFLTWAAFCVLSALNISLVIL